jgi:Xaa-Pro aminopeptidase
MRADARLAAYRDRLAQSESTAALVSGLANVRYLTGFEDVFDDHANAVLLVTADVASVHTDSRYAGATRVAAEGTGWELVVQRDSLYMELCDRLEAMGVDRVALESSVPYGRFRYISERFSGGIEIEEHWVERLRASKEPAELDRIAAASELGDRAFAHILERIEEGRTERELALELEWFMRTSGSEGVAFPPIVASGPNSARPHATVTDRELGRGDLVKLDFGARVGGYCSDMTRTVVVGEAGERELELHEAVLEANQAALAALRPGMPVRELDAVARDSLAARGLGDAFLHGLGHGVGLDVHEAPRIGRTSEESLPLGGVVTIEPGAYVEGLGGVRIEDLVSVGPDGPEVLTHAPKHLIEL